MVLLIYKIILFTQSIRIDRDTITINIDKLGIMIGNLSGMPALDQGDDTTVSPEAIDVTPDK